MSLGEVQNIVLTVTGVAGVLIAGIGLKTWRQQLHGTADFETGRAILRGLYSVRDAVRNARQSGQQAGEGNPQPGDDPVVAAYQARWNHLLSAQRDLEVALLEGEIAWGDELKMPEQELIKHLAKLKLAMKHYVASRTDQHNQDIFNQQRDGALIWGNDGDEYDNKLVEIIGSLERIVKPHLKK